MVNEMDNGTLMRRAFSSYDVDAPLTADEMLKLAADIEECLIESEANFSHPDWRYVDGLRATVRHNNGGIEGAGSVPSRDHASRSVGNASDLDPQPHHDEDAK